MADWFLRVWRPSGTHYADRGPEGGGIAEITRARVAPSGNCEEMEFVASAYHSGIRARDLVQLFVSDAQTDLPGGTGDFRPVWKGVVVRAGNPRRRDLRTFRALGLAHRLRELHVPHWRAGAGEVDVAEHVRAAVRLNETETINSSHWRWPEGVDYSDARVPPLGLSLGDTFPGLNTLGEWLDAMKATVGEFIVPTGETYSHDGRTWTAGETVPATAWGVDGSGRFFFRRPSRSAGAANEVDGHVAVDWLDVEAENVADHAVVVYAANMAEGALVPGKSTPQHPPQPLYRTYGEVADFGYPTGDLMAAHLVVLENPLDWMKRAAIASVANFELWADEANATDGDDATYALSDTGSGLGWWRVRLDSAMEGILRLRLQLVEARTLLITYWSRFDNGALETQGFYEVDLPTGLQTLFFPLLANALFQGAAPLQVKVEGFSTDDRVYDFSVWEPDDARVARMVEGAMRGVTQDASEVRVYGIADAARHRVKLTTIEGATLDLAVEAVEYRLTSDDGLLTAYLLEQSDDGEAANIEAHLNDFIDARAKRRAEQILRRRLGAVWS